jgi:hypothetical protein
MFLNFVKALAALVAAAVIPGGVILGILLLSRSWREKHRPAK